LADTEISLTALPAGFPKVDAVNFYNMSPTTGLPVLEHTFTSAFNVAPDANVIIDSSDGVIDLSVEAGAGTGLYDACSVSTDTINTINYIASDNGHFLIQGDGCYHIELETNGVKFINGCTPKCTADQINYFSHYESRIHDGLLDVGTYGETVKDAIEAHMVDYLANVVPLKTVSTFDSIFVKTRDTYYSYYAFTIGLYNPSKVARSVTMTVAPFGGAFMLHTIKYLVPGQVTNFYASITSQTFSVPCLNYGTLVFVVRVGDGYVAKLDITSTFSPFTKNYILVGSSEEPVSVPTFGLDWVDTTIDSGYAHFYPHLTGVMYNPTGSTITGTTTGTLTNATLSSGTMNLSSSIVAGGAQEIDFTLTVAADHTGILGYGSNLAPTSKVMQFEAPKPKVTLASAKGESDITNTYYYISGTITNPVNQVLSINIAPTLTGCTLSGSAHITAGGTSTAYGSFPITGFSMPAGGVCQLDFKLAVPLTTTGSCIFNLHYSSVLSDITQTFSLPA